MLRLDRMEIAGFKSFGDRTEVRFPEGITAVVGPNGCGKSNIGDAINWVLGEQSAKMLRGRQMADVIFSGSATRKPVGLAQVSLIFRGAEGLPQHDQGRITITRRLFRDGDSEYELNGKRSRLRDIQEILRQGNVGARTYATIEQGKIDQVLNAKPRERRALIEDAAGISGYKHKRRLAELKLDATQANLLRVQDIISEVRRQINSLKRQAAKARRYRRLREELREREMIRFAGRAAKMDELLSVRGEAEREARDAESAAAAGLAKSEAELVERREQLAASERVLRETSEAKHALEIEIDRAEASIRALDARIEESTAEGHTRREEAQALGTRRESLDERIAEHTKRLAEVRTDAERLQREAGERLEALQSIERQRAELREAMEGNRRRQFEAMGLAADLRNRLRSSEEAIERVIARRARFEQERAEAQAEHSETSDRAERLAEGLRRHEAELGEWRERLERDERILEEKRQAHAEAVEALAGAREREKSVAASLATLDDVATRFAGQSDGVTAVLGAGGSHGIRSHGVVADFVEANREVEGVAETYLSALLPTVILEDDGDASRAASLLSERGAARTTLICRTQPAGALAVGCAHNGHGGPPEEILRDSRVVGRLRDRLTLKSSANGVLADRIGDAVLVRDLEAALALHRRCPSLDYLTVRGEIVYASGVISAGGERAKNEGLLAHRRRVDELRVEHGVLRARATDGEQAVQRGRDEVVALELGVRELRQRVEQAERRSVELRMHQERSGEETERSDRRARVLAEELAALVAEHAELSRGTQLLVTERQRAEDSHTEIERTVAGQAEQIERFEGTLDERRERLTDVRAEAAAAAQRLEALETEGRALAEGSDELRARHEAVERAIGVAERRVVDSGAERERIEAALADQVRAREERAAQARTTEAEIAEQREGVERLEGAVRLSRTEIESLRAATNEAELARTRTEADRAHLDDLCRQELGMTAAEAATNVEASSADADLDAVEAQVEEIRARIERIGPVNLTAIDEFSELEERDRFLTEQRTDLESSMESLRESIRRINRESRQRFSEAFEAIRASYKEIFATLFRGGRGDLRLEEGEDVLESGIEILAQPPGKRLSGIHLMSGGEKALSAIALLFAIFRYQPSPFCLLDEVDAALDDANVSRFTNMVREYAANTQFVLITHNKLSMEVADLLYGVTMEQAGISKVVSLQLQ